MKTITICSSANFYKHAADVQDELQSKGFTVLVPHNVTVMRKSGDFDASHYRTWLTDDADYDQKTNLMRLHFDEIEKGDMILVINDEKHGRPGYIGGNVLIEMALAFYLKKPIYLLNRPDPGSAYLEEIIGMQPTIVNGDLSIIQP